MRRFTWLIGLLVACGEGAPPAAQYPDEPAATALPVLEAIALAEGESVRVDASTADAAWARARELVVPLDDGPVPEVRLKAAADADHFYLLAVWRDPDATRNRHWTYRGKATWDRTELEDAFAVCWAPPEAAAAFREQGCTLFCHGDGHGYDALDRGHADFWFWGAQSTSGFPQADDLWLPFGPRQGLRGDSQPDDSGNVPNVSAEPGYVGPLATAIRVRTTYNPVLTLSNAQPLTRERLLTKLTQSAQPGWRIPLDLQRARGGSRGDVLAAARHMGNGWVLELSRALRTGNRDDLPLDDAAAGTVFAVAVDEASGGRSHQVSGPIELRFLTRP